MASNKTLELRKIKIRPSRLGKYMLNPLKTNAPEWIRAFQAGDIIKSRDGKTEYLVGNEGNFIRKS